MIVTLDVTPLTNARIIILAVALSISAHLVSLDVSARAISSGSGVSSVEGGRSNVAAAPCSNIARKKRGVSSSKHRRSSMRHGETWHISDNKSASA